MAKILPIPIRPKTAQNRVRAIAKTSRRIIFPDNLKEDTWVSRVTNLQVQQCLLRGSIVGEPFLDEFNNWNVKFQLFITGVLMSVDVAIIKNDGETEEMLVIRNVYV